MNDFPYHQSFTSLLLVIERCVIGTLKEQNSAYHHKKWDTPVPERKPAPNRIRITIEGSALAYDRGHVRAAIEFTNLILPQGRPWIRPRVSSRKPQLLFRSLA